jgi:hypothetical protein
VHVPHARGSATTGNAQSVEAFVVFRKMLQIHMKALVVSWITIAARKCYLPYVE